VKRVDAGRYPAVLMLARLLADRTMSGPLLLVDGDDELAVMIRAQAYAPRLDDFEVTLTGAVHCKLCDSAEVASSRLLGDALDAANRHWADRHRPGAPNAPGKFRRTAPVAYISEAHEQLEDLFGKTGTLYQVRTGRNVIHGWYGKAAGSGWYYILKDGRYGGPYSMPLETRMAGIERSAGGE
jgi:hypothetical protein